MYSNQYIDQLIQKLSELERRCLREINLSAQMVFNTIQNGHQVYFFGCTHAGILAQESFYRTGGLAIINPIFPPGLNVQDTPVSITSELERVNGYGKIIAEQSGIQDGDLLFIHSVSGRNSVPIDFAKEAKDAGVTVIAITSLEYSSRSQSRHPSGKRLFEVCDLVIDDVCPFGDALVTLGVSGVRVAPGSTVLGVAILNAIVAEAAGLFDEKGVLPPVYQSVNVDKGDDYNRKVFETYKKQIGYKLR